ncbi:MAG: leucyl/phenylalanyl-tRNA--protein transferase [Rhodovulum sulfidophilum]|uniref:Leucyl/phenylalanyl-tRNA--protein transferase n=1 Tax=Rhodovulum sulfidophilum TaxID=35806 RepID=A0A2W5N6R7_RHOSU|nr:MAG: leucyl/phenylalanyl-tRNA--protein transferase [Rhodovulum sulfidophilum]
MADDWKLTPELLLRAYASGVFPMADSAEAEELFWVDPIRRGVLPLDGLHVSRRLARDFLGRDFEIRVDADFPGTVRACADRATTWINAEIFRLYRELNRMGHAHSVEVWQDGALAGGLYGVALGGAFFGESMFSRMRDGSKFALVALIARLRAGGFTLLDTQFVTPHLISLGAIEIDRADYRAALAAALRRPADFRALPPEAPRARMLELARG